MTAKGLETDCNGAPDDAGSWRRAQSADGWRPRGPGQCRQCAGAGLGDAVLRAGVQLLTRAGWRRPRLPASVAVAALVALSVVGCGADEPAGEPAGRGTAAAEGAGDGTVSGPWANTVMFDTPEGPVAFGLVAEPAEVGLDEQVTVWLANHGALALRSGYEFRVEFLDAGGWVEVPWPDTAAAPGEELPLPVGGPPVRGVRWPFTDHRHPQPGRYRIEWTATLEPGAIPDRDKHQPYNWFELTAQAYFDVHP